MRAWGRTGVPRALRDLEDFAAMSERLAGAAEVADYTFFWWKIRPHPRLGTVEVRTMDTQTSLVTTAGLAALVHALALHEATAPPAPEMPAELLDEGMFRAGRYGVQGTLPDGDGTLRPVGAVLTEALALAAPHARELGCEDELDELRRLPAEGGGAGRQRAAHAEGAIPGLLDWLVRETAAARPLDS
jgi:carboxylate-amine ligase